MHGKQRQQINVYLFSPTVTTFEQALAEKVDPDDHIPLVPVPGFEMRLYVRVRNSRRTRWMKMLEDGLAPGTPDPFSAFRNKTPSAALIIKKGSQFMSATFGQGRHLINLPERVKRFGLIVALNLAPEYGIRKIQTRTHSDFTQTRAISNSRLTGLQRFGYDSEEDLLVQVSAKLAANKTTGYTISGKDVVNIVTDISWSGLPIRCDRLARIYRRDWRKRKFPDTTNLEPITDPQITVRLDNAMCLALCQPEASGFHLAPYDVLLDSEEGYGFAADYDLGGADPVLELDLAQFLAATGFSGPADLPILRDCTIRYLYQSGAIAAGPWPVADCLVGEIVDNGITYVLTGGQWLAPEVGYLDRVNSIVSTLAPDPALPNFLATGVHTENELIDRAIQAYGNGYEKIHPRSIVWDGGTNRIEFADCIADKKLVYAKLQGSARDTSHLLTQAANGIRALAAKDFRDAARAQYGGEIPGTLRYIPVDAPTLSEWSVVLLMGSKRSRPPQELPVVQRIALKRLLRRLQAVWCQAHTPPSCRLTGLPSFLERIRLPRRIRMGIGRAAQPPTASSRPFTRRIADDHVVLPTKPKAVESRTISTRNLGT
jgi:uncharacterized protein (TIGR04141 family)